MFNKYSTSAFFSTLFFEAIIIYTGAKSYSTGQDEILKLSVAAATCLLIPFLLVHVANKKKLTLPPGFQMILSIFIFSALYLGEINKFYSKFWWFDLLLHFVSGWYAVVLFLFLIKTPIKKEHGTSHKRFEFFKSISAFSFSVSLGTLWEMYEFSGDYLFGTEMVKGGLDDTATDLLIMIAAAILTSSFYYFKNRKSSL
jgi:hypothetical protein